MQTTENNQQQAPGASSQPAVGPEKLPGIHHIIAVGSGKGCASSQVTLRQGFEVMVKRVAPETLEILDATDHAAGKQPFYPQQVVPHD
ncbi:MAG: NifU family protein [Candidatus Methylopumilus sp.]|nr:NifU family protein [Candidatus Methylopumilus sp.]